MASDSDTPQLTYRRGDRYLPSTSEVSLFNVDSTLISGMPSLVPSCEAMSAAAWPATSWRATGVPARSVLCADSNEPPASSSDTIWDCGTEGSEKNVRRG